MNITQKKTVFACALMMFAFAGLTTNGFSVYQPYILSVNGFTNAQGSVVLTVRNISSLLAMLISARLYRKISVRKGIALGGLAASLGLMLFSVSHSFFAYCIAGFVMGIAFGTSGTIPLAIVTMRGFGNNKTKVLGFCAAMTGLSTLGVPFLIVSLTEKHGLPTMFGLESLFELAATIIIYILMKNGPAETTEEAPTAADNGISSGYYPFSGKEPVILFFIALFAGAVGFVGITNLSVLCTGSGFSTKTAAAFVCVSGIVLTISKSLYGFAKEKIGAHSCQLVYAFMLVAGQILFSFMRDNTFILYMSVCMFSVGLSFLTVGIADWAGTLAPEGRRAEMIQMSQVGYMVGALLFSPVPGIIADQQGGSYTIVYLLFALLSVLSVGLNYYECKKHLKRT